jgi:hypothetical protein
LILSSVIKGEIEKKEKERKRAGGEEGELKRQIEKKEYCAIMICIFLKIIDPIKCCSCVNRR